MIYILPWVPCTFWLNTIDLGNSLLGLPHVEFGSILPIHLVLFGLSKWVECPATSRAKPMAKPSGPCSKRLPEWSAALQASLERTPWCWCLHWSIAVQSPMIWLPCTLGRQFWKIQFQLSGAHSDAIVSPSRLSSYIVSCGILGPQKSYGQSPGKHPVDTTPPTHTEKHLLHIQPQI
jgi:hypothetical protein